jgi:hypothetical protein
MYKILNKLFGWDYVYYDDIHFSRGIARIHKYPDNNVFFIIPWPSEKMVKLPSQEYYTQFLTCKPEKYIN